MQKLKERLDPIVNSIKTATAKTKQDWADKINEHKEKAKAFLDNISRKSQDSLNLFTHTSLSDLLNVKQEGSKYVGGRKKRRKTHRRKTHRRKTHRRKCKKTHRKKHHKTHCKKRRKSQCKKCCKTRRKKRHN